MLWHRRYYTSRTRTNNAIIHIRLREARRIYQYHCNVSRNKTVYRRQRDYDNDRLRGERVYLLCTIVYVCVGYENIIIIYKATATRMMMMMMMFTVYGCLIRSRSLRHSDGDICQSCFYSNNLKLGAEKDLNIHISFP